MNRWPGKLFALAMVASIAMLWGTKGEARAGGVDSETVWDILLSVVWDDTDIVHVRPAGPVDPTALALIGVDVDDAWPILNYIAAGPVRDGTVSTVTGLIGVDVDDAWPIMTMGRVDPAKGLPDVTSLIGVDVDDAWPIMNAQLVPLADPHAMPGSPIDFDNSWPSPNMYFLELGLSSDWSPIRMGVAKEVESAWRAIGAALAGPLAAGAEVAAGDEWLLILRVTKAESPKPDNSKR